MRAPSARKRPATARPSPDAPPVIIAMMPSRRIARSLVTECGSIMSHIRCATQRVLVFERAQWHGLIGGTITGELRMTSSSSEPRRLAIRVMAAYGFGQFGEALVTIGFTTFLLYYYNQVLGVSGTITGIALAISLLVDAVVDPVAGSLSDRLHSRWGRRHPFILLSAIPLGGCFFLIFNPPAALVSSSSRRGWSCGRWPRGSR